jgi:hypothetical protein
MIEYRTDLDKVTEKNDSIKSMRESKLEESMTPRRITMKFCSDKNIENYSLDEKMTAIKKWAVNLSQNDENIIE